MGYFDNHLGVLVKVDFSVKFNFNNGAIVVCFYHRHCDIVNSRISIPKKKKKNFMVQFCANSDN